MEKIQKLQVYIKTKKIASQKFYSNSILLGNFHVAQKSYKLYPINFYITYPFSQMKEINGDVQITK